jgi:hypothetical protein
MEMNPQSQGPPAASASDTPDSKITNRWKKKPTYQKYIYTLFISTIYFLLLKKDIICVKIHNLKLKYTPTVRVFVPINYKMDHLHMQNLARWVEKQELASF